MSRTKRLMVDVTLLEKKRIDREAKEAKLTTADYIRSKLGLFLAKGGNNFEEAPDPLHGDPDNALDVEGLARKIYAEAEGFKNLMTIAKARQEAKRRLMAAREQQES